MGARFEYEGKEYEKTGPMLASCDGATRLIPKYAELGVIGEYAPPVRGCQIWREVWVMAQAATAGYRVREAPVYPVFLLVRRPDLPADMRSIQVNLALQDGFLTAYQQALPDLVQQDVGGLVGHAQARPSCRAEMPFTALVNRITAARYRRSGSLWKAKNVPEAAEKSS